MAVCKELAVIFLDAVFQWSPLPIRVILDTRLAKGFGTIARSSSMKDDFQWNTVTDN